MELTSKELEAICTRAANTAIAIYVETHPCKLSKEERSMIHSQYESMVEEGATNGTWRVLIQWGVNLTDVTKFVRRTVLVLLGGAAVILFIRWQWK